MSPQIIEAGCGFPHPAFSAQYEPLPCELPLTSVVFPCLPSSSLGFCYFPLVPAILSPRLRISRPLRFSVPILCPFLYGTIGYWRVVQGAYGVGCFEKVGSEKGTGQNKAPAISLYRGQPERIVKGCFGVFRGRFALFPELPSAVVLSWQVQAGEQAVREVGERERKCGCR